MRVTAYVYVHDADGRRHAALAPGDEVPSWAVVTNPAVLVADEAAAPAPALADEQEAQPKPRTPRRRKPAASE